MPPISFYLSHHHFGDLVSKRAVGGTLKAKHMARSADQRTAAIHKIESSAGRGVEFCGEFLTGTCAAQGPSTQHFKAERMKKGVYWRRNALMWFPR